MKAGVVSFDMPPTAKRTSVPRQGSAWFGWNEGGPDRGVTWGSGGRDRDRALLRRGPEENAPPSAALSHSAIILWWQTSAAAKRSVALTLSAFYIQNGRLRGDRCWPWPVSHYEVPLTRPSTPTRGPTHQASNKLEGATDGKYRSPAHDW